MIHPPLTKRKHQTYSHNQRTHGGRRYPKQRRLIEVNDDDDPPTIDIKKAHELHHIDAAPNTFKGLSYCCSVSYGLICSLCVYQQWKVQ
jgi:hypothetical protein